MKNHNKLLCNFHKFLHSPPTQVPLRLSPLALVLLINPLTACKLKLQPRWMTSPPPPYRRHLSLSLCFLSHSSLLPLLINYSGSRFTLPLQSPPVDGIKWEIQLWRFVSRTMRAEHLFSHLIVMCFCATIVSSVQLELHKLRVLWKMFEWW